MKNVDKNTSFRQTHHKPVDSQEERKLLEKKVADGTQKAIKEYGEVFRRLAEYDKE